MYEICANRHQTFFDTVVIEADSDKEELLNDLLVKNGLYLSLNSINKQPIKSLDKFSLCEFPILL